MAYVGFKKLAKKLSARKGVKSSGGLARWIGERKYGKKGFAARQKSGRMD